MPNDVSAWRARELFDYDSKTGSLIWKCGRRSGLVAGCLRSDGYIFIKVDGKMYAAHRVAWCHYHGFPAVGEVDHKDRIRSNNAVENLRQATPRENRVNSSLKSTNSSGFRGVSFDKRRNAYVAHIRVEGAKRFLGYFADPAVAGAAYEAAAQKSHGQFFAETGTR